jgi:hypothetical protein
MTSKADHLPELPPPYMRSEYRSIPPRPPVSLFMEDQMREYGKLCAERERERCVDEIEAIRTNGRAVNLSAGEIMRNEIADDLLAAIRGQEGK